MCFGCHANILLDIETHIKQYINYNHSIEDGGLLGLIEGCVHTNIIVRLENK